MTRTALLLIMLFQANISLAWNAAGHQLMAAMTWDLLDDKQQDYWVDILKHHPRFLKDFKKNIPKHVKFNPSAYNEWVFRQASIWPDLARGFQKNLKDRYHHGSWHYINYPVYLDEKLNTAFLNLDTDFKNTFHNGLNIIQALKGNLNTLSKQGATKKEKALALSWVLHLIGDAHQPLHSTALFSSDYFPEGDRGGNLVKIGGQGQIKNLHWYWDSRLNNSTSFKIIDLKAKKLNKKNHTDASDNKKETINQWLLNGNKLAKKYVYTPVLMKILRENEHQQNAQPSIYISSSYDKQAKSIAEQQISKAAFRLAYILSMLK